MGISCVCNTYYSSCLVQRYYKCKQCGHVWDLRPDVADVPDRNQQIRRHEEEA
jgi:hypothetical protein